MVDLDRTDAIIIFRLSLPMRVDMLFVIILASCYVGSVIEIWGQYTVSY